MLLKFLGKYRDAGLFIMRLGLGSMFMLHGLPKLMGGPAKWATYGKAMGYIGLNFLPKFWGFMAALSEGVGGLLLIIGFVYRPVALLLTFTMFIAAMKLHHEHADFQALLSRPIELAFVFFGMACIGPGRFSVDKD